MTKYLKNRVNLIQEAAREIGSQIIYTPNEQQGRMVILQNEEKSKVVAAFDVTLDSPGDPAFKYFKIHTHKWEWAITEGFTPQQMYNKLGSKVFENLSELAVVAYLS